MSSHSVGVVWVRGDQVFTDRKYLRMFSVQLDGGVTLSGSASPHVVPSAYVDAQSIDPEEAFVMSLSSCHMLWFLDFAARAGYRVDHYQDRAVGTLGKDPSGKIVMLKVGLYPEVVFSGEKLPTEEAHQRLHHQAHEACFLANSVKAEVSCSPHFYK